MEVAHSLPAPVVRPGFWSEFAARIAAVRCRLLHRNISRPVNGKYMCWTCLHEFRVEW